MSVLPAMRHVRVSPSALRNAPSCWPMSPAPARRVAAAGTKRRRPPSTPRRPGFHLRGGGQDFAEGVHPFTRFLVGLDAALGALLRLFEAFQAHFELQRRPAVTARDRNEEPRRELLAPCRFHLAVDEVDGAL